MRSLFSSHEQKYLVIVFLKQKRVPFYRNVWKSDSSLRSPVTKLKMMFNSTIT